MANSDGTDTDPGAGYWGINDRVTQLRLWGAGVVFPLPDAGDDLILGASHACSIKIDDPLKHVSRIHARLSRTRKGWMVFDLDSKNGIHLDGAQQAEVPLHPEPSSGSEESSSSPKALS